MAAWHPRAIRIVYPSMGAYTGGGRKLLWHTTEGYSLPRYSGSNPHFTLNPATGQLWQHQPITEPSRALVHTPGTPETNRANVVQVELIGFAAQTHDWPDAYYGNISALARWIEANHGVPSKSTVAFTSTATQQARRLTGMEFVVYSGHLGHEHAPPNNVHWDPSRFRIGDVLANPVARPGARPLRLPRHGAVAGLEGHGGQDRAGLDQPAGRPAPRPLPQAGGRRQLRGADQGQRRSLPAPPQPRRRRARGTDHLERPTEGSRMTPFDPVQHLAKVQTVGIAQKVSWPAVALAALGVAGLVAGILLDSVELRSVGAALIGASGVTGLLGYSAPPPAVEHVVRVDQTEVGERTAEEAV
jgi:hypothetical protein